MACFRGEYSCTLDEKNRIRLPAKLRAGVGTRFVLMKGTNRSIAVYPEATYDEISARLEQIDEFDIEKQKGLRYFFSGSDDIEIDDQGRFVLVQKLRDYARIQKNIVIVGVGKKIEIWAKENYDEYLDENEYDEGIKQLKRDD